MFVDTIKHILFKLTNRKKKQISDANTKEEFQHARRRAQAYTTGPTSA